MDELPVQCRDLLGVVEDYLRPWTSTGFSDTESERLEINSVASFRGSIYDKIISLRLLVGAVCQRLVVGVGVGIGPRRLEGRVGEVPPH